MKPRKVLFPELKLVRCPSLACTCLLAVSLMSFVMRHDISLWTWMNLIRLFSDYCHVIQGVLLKHLSRLLNTFSMK